MIELLKVCISMGFQPFSISMIFEKHLKHIPMDGRTKIRESSRLFSTISRASALFFNTTYSRARLIQRTGVLSGRALRSWLPLFQGLKRISFSRQLWHKEIYHSQIYGRLFITTDRRLRFLHSSHAFYKRRCAPFGWSVCNA